MRVVTGGGGNSHCDDRRSACVLLVNTPWKMSLVRSMLNMQITIIYMKTEPAFITDHYRVPLENEQCHCALSGNLFWGTCFHSPVPNDPTWHFWDHIWPVLCCGYHAVCHYCYDNVLILASICIMWPSITWSTECSFDTFCSCKFSSSTDSLHITCRGNSPKLQFRFLKAHSQSLLKAL